MAESLLNSLMLTLGRGTTSQIAQKLGEPEGAVSRGLESSVATVLAGLSTKAEDPGTLRRILELVPGVSGSWSSVANELTNATSTILTGGKRILSGLFGSAEGPLTSAIGHEAGLGSNSASTLLAMAAPMVTGFLSSKLRDRDMTVSGLGAMLSSEAAILRRALPASAADLIWRRKETPLESPVVAQSIRRESGFPWAGALALGALALGCLWLFTHNRAAQIGSAATGAANRLSGDPGNILKQRSPRLDVKIPDGTGESRLLSFVQDSAAIPGSGTWFDFDRLRFDSGSTVLKPEASGELDNMAAIFKAYPQLEAKVAGYTDSRGSASANLALSEARANTVKGQLIARGVSSNRLTAEGMGPNNPAADNSTEAGRADNRRVALLITDK